MGESKARLNRISRILAIIVCVIGLVMFVFGIGTYVFTSQQLGSQGITVSAATADDPGSLVGKPVNGPFTALAQANAINHHALAAGGGKTYAELPNVATSDGKTYNKDVAQESSTDGQAHAAGDPLSEQDAASYAARSTAQQAALLQASLFVSVLAFGVSVLIIALGLVLVMIALALLGTLPPKQKTQPASASD